MPRYCCLLLNSRSNEKAIMRRAIDNTIMPIDYPRLAYAKVVAAYAT
jgi:hypothetical protein